MSGIANVSILHGYSRRMIGSFSTTAGLLVLFLLHDILSEKILLCYNHLGVYCLRPLNMFLKHRIENNQAYILQ